MSRIKPIEHAAHAPHNAAAKDWTKMHVSQDTWNMVFVVVAAVLIIGIVAGIGNLVSSVPGTSSAPATAGKTAAQAAEDTRKFIVDYMVPEGVTVAVMNTTEESGLYAVGIKLTSGTDTIEAVAYVSKDGTLLFTQGINMPKERAKPTATPTPTPAPFDAPNAEKPEAAFFVMSFCPFGQAAEEGLEPVFRALGDAVDLQPHYVIYDNYCGYGVACKCPAGASGCTENAAARVDYCLDATEETPKYCSMHGINELREDIRQMCVLKEYGKEAFWDYVKYIYTDSNACILSNIDSCWKDAAAAAGADVATIESCANSEGLSLVAAEAALNNELGVRGSPTVFVNGADYDLSTYGGSAENYKDAVCSGFETQPSACSSSLSDTAASASGSC